MSSDGSGEGLEHWKKLAESRRVELDELVEMSVELEGELEAALKKKCEEFDQVQSTLASTQALLEKARRDQNEAARASDSVMEELDSLRESDAKNKARARDLETQTDELEAKVRTLEATEKDLSEQLDAATEQTVFLTGEKEEDQEALERLRSELQELQSELQAREVASSNQVASVSTSAKELEATAKRIEELQTDVVYWKQHAESLEGKNAELESERISSQEANAALEDAKERAMQAEQALAARENNGNADAMAKVSELAVLLEDARHELLGRQTSIDELKKELAESQRETAEAVNSLKVSEAAASAAARALETDSEAAAAAAASSYQELNQAAENRGVLEDRIIELESLLAQESAKTQASIQSAASGALNLENQVAELTEKCASLESEAEEWAKESTEQEAEIERLRLNIESDAKHAVMLEQNINELRDQVAALEKMRTTASVASDELKVANRSIELLREEIAVLQSQCIEEGRRASQAESALKELESSTGSLAARAGRVETLEAALESEKTKVHELSTALDKEKNERAELEITVNDGGGLPTSVVQLRQAYIAQLKTNTTMAARIQKLRGNILVCCRVRPLLGNEKLGGSKGGEAGMLAVESLSSEELAFYSEKSKSYRPFAFDRVFASGSTQIEVNREMANLGIAESVVAGERACIMAYGQTGSGKTYTMDGPIDNPGINSMTIRRVVQLVDLLRASGQGSYKVMIAMVEIYNEDVRDLLESMGGGSRSDPVTNKDLPSSGSSVASTASGAPTRRPRGNASQVNSLGIAADVSWVECDTVEQVDKALNVGRANRSVAATNLNLHSSRSHLIIMLQVTGTPNGSPEPGVTDSSTTTDGRSENDSNGDNVSTTTDKSRGGSSTVTQTGLLYLVDLAGSERVSKSGVVGSRLDETKAINRSLSALGDVMEALDSKDRNRHVPYRNSKLTHLLQPVLGNNSRSVMILTVPPTRSSAQETLFSLQFAARARNIELGPAKRRVEIKNAMAEKQVIVDQLSQAKSRAAAAESRVAELKRERHTMEQRMAAIKSEGTKSAEASNKRLENELIATSRELSELRTKFQTLREANKAYKEEAKAAEQQSRIAQKDLTVKNTMLSKIVKEKTFELNTKEHEIIKLRSSTSLDSTASNASGGASGATNGASTFSGSARKMRFKPALSVTHSQSPARGKISVDDGAKSAASPPSPPPSPNGSVASTASNIPRMSLGPSRKSTASAVTRSGSKIPRPSTSR